MNLLATLATLLPTLASYRPLLDPLPVDRHWPWLLLPLAVLIAIAYKAIKVSDLAEMKRQVTVLSVQIVVGMVLAAAALWALVAAI